MFKRWAVREAELNVALFIEDQVTIKGQFRKLVAVLEAWNIFEVSNLVVRQEGSLQPGAMVQPIDLIDDIAAQVELSQRDESTEVVNCLDEVVRQVEDSKLSKVIDVFNSSDFVRMQIKNVQFRQILKVLDLFDIVLTKHEHT